MGIAEGATGETIIVCREGEPAPPHPGKAIAAKANKPVTHRFKPQAGPLILQIARRGHRWNQGSGRRAKPHHSMGIISTRTVWQTVAHDKVTIATSVHRYSRG
jgi:hypothetical protein